MKKLFSLLTLLVAIGTSAWADDTYEYTHTPALNTDNYFTAAKGSESVKTFNVDITFNLADGTSTKVTKAVKMEAATTITFTTTRTSDVSIGIFVRNDASSESRNNSVKFDGTQKGITETDANSYNIVTITDVEAGEHTIAQSGKEAEVYYVKVVEKGALTSPVITVPSTASIKTKTSGVEATEDIAVSGENLTGSTLTATLSPAVDGLSVTLASNTITAGAISTTATLHYTKTTNASGSTTLTLSDGTTSKDVTVNYKALVVPTELTAISEETTFNLGTVGTSDLDAVTSEDGYVVLTDAGSEVAFANKLAVAGNVTWRNDAIQTNFFKFKTTVPGTVTVKFSDTGSAAGRANRYANVNGARSDVYSNTSASEGVKTCSPIAVSAGEVVIKGQQAGDTFTDTNIRVFTITFTPLATGDAVTLSDYEWATFVPTRDIDFTGTAVKAYIVKGQENKVLTTTQVNKVAAGTPLLINASMGSYEIPALSASADATTGNLLQAGTGATVSAEANKTKYALSVDGGVATFKKIASSATIPVGKAYLEFAEEINAPELTFDFGNTTGVNEVRGKKEEVRGEYYNLNGQRVAQPTKGLYIVNGKKVILK